MRRTLLHDFDRSSSFTFVTQDRIPSRFEEILRSKFCAETEIHTYEMILLPKMKMISLPLKSRHFVVEVQYKMSKITLFVRVLPVNHPPLIDNRF